MESENTASQQVQRPPPQKRSTTMEQNQKYLAIMSDPSLLLYNSMMEGKNEMAYKTKLFYTIGASKSSLVRDHKA